MGRRGRGRHARRRLPLRTRRPSERDDGRGPSRRHKGRRVGTAGIPRESPHMAGGPIRGPGTGACRRGHPATLPARRDRRRRPAGGARRIGRCGTHRRRGVRHFADHAHRRHGRGGPVATVSDAAGGVRASIARRRTPSGLRGVDPRTLRGAAHLQRLQRDEPRFPSGGREEEERAVELLAGSARFDERHRFSGARTGESGRFADTVRRAWMRRRL